MSKKLVLSEFQDIGPHFGMDVREIRLSLKLAPEAFAQQVKISTASLQRIEDGDIKSSMLVCKKIQRFLRMVLALRMVERMGRLRKRDEIRFSRSKVREQLLEQAKGLKHKKREV